eukprot:m.207342 g.207342  ORF g.207342 m.207342 type:complete len:853 (+) comp32982_c0_seq1:157-2715(+)
MFSLLRISGVVGVVVMLLGCSEQHVFAKSLTKTPVEGDIRTSVHVDESTGDYKVMINGLLWLRSASTTVTLDGKEYSSADKTLTLSTVSTYNGGDATGQYNATRIQWMAGKTNFETHFRQYSTNIVFLQVYPEGAKNTSMIPSTSNEQPDGIISHFPAFVAETTTPQRGFVNWANHGVPNADWMTTVGANTVKQKEIGEWPPQGAVVGKSRDNNNVNETQQTVLTVGWESVGALAIFDRAGDVTTVVSSFSSFDTTNIGYQPPSSAQGTGVLSYGPRSSIEEFPSGFTNGVIIQAGSGIRSTMRSWGLTLMKHANKNPDAWKDDFSMKYLGYTTDNGAYYYYNTIPGQNYEETILALHTYTVTEKIPIKWILYDSWFYSKSNDTGSHMMDPAHGCLNWTDADPKIFPSGLRSIYKATGWQVVAHARAWADDNVYATNNGGKYPFVAGKDLEGQAIGLPLTSEFWDDLFVNAREWGCLQYQQDWMYTQAGQIDIRNSATLGKQWRLQMTDALALNDMRFGFGGVMPVDWLMSTEQQAVTNGRVSDDYHANLSDLLGALNWDIGVSSIFCWALSVIPAKDGYWTTPSQPGHPYKDNRTEPYGALHSAVATLSRGPVSPADKIGLFNRSMIMRSCMDDGTLLQPDMPAQALDSQLLNMAFGDTGPNGGIWNTHTTIGPLDYHHVLVPLLRSPYSLSLKEIVKDCEGCAGLQSNMQTVVIENANGRTTKAMVLNDENDVMVPVCDQGTFKLYHTVPVTLNGWGFAGELDKWVPVSSARVRSINIVGDSIEAELSGTAGEKIQITFVHLPSTDTGVTTTINDNNSSSHNQVEPVLVFVDCVFDATERVTVTPTGCQA